MKDLGLIVLSSILTVTGQFLFKLGMASFPNLQFEGLAAVRTLVQILLSPKIVAGFVAFGAGAVIWLVVLSRSDISYAVPISSLSYIVILLLGKYFFDEQISLLRLAGTLTVMIGIVLISLPAK